ncbi:MAG: hypothetical protein MUF47_13970 [Porphyrobacter sp.]|jgi:hypothetical protein|nr:hypothetical protein [Porphyrobacter sp.]
MHSLFALAAPLALIMPWLADGAAVPDGAPARGSSAPQCDAAQLEDAPVVNPLSAYRSSATARQVRIEQRVVVRITPQPPAARQELLGDLRERQYAPRFEERDKAKCVALQNIAWVETGSGNKLVLVMRDRQLMSVNLEKSCRARDFYSGFYVEKSKDGRVCVDRDHLQSRTGARCEVEGIRQLVEVSR